ncbi:MarR family winged helix-turn-helix transcriptional regulator [Knoellia sp. CPCC 206450]|uniref:MarR family winged helix-turn-helix transcriptional regulator n=1 Tax=Knoellia tibetensis TaxID=3404798 RepID=UPI003B436946
MSDISERRDPSTTRPTSAGPATARPSAPREERTTARSVAPAYEHSPSLEALEELVALAAQTPQAVARRGGLSVSELHSLRHLSSTPMGPVELAKVLGVTSAASSGVVDRLVARGHAERRPRADDGRRTEVVVTESGRREIFALLAPMFASLAETDNALTDEERVVVERYLRGAIAALRSVM